MDGRLGQLFFSCGREGLGEENVPLALSADSFALPRTGVKATASCGSIRLHFDLVYGISVPMSRQMHSSIFALHIVPPEDL